LSKPEKTRNSGQWSESRFKSFIKSALRSASNRWGPKFECKKEARVERGKYLCAGYQKEPHVVPATIKEGNKRVNYVAVDHVHPVIDPEKGWQSWDDVVARMFVELPGLQLLCNDCHAAKSSDERKQRKKQ
jgi:hypothetical protein